MTDQEQSPMTIYDTFRNHRKYQLYIQEQSIMTSEKQEFDIPAGTYRHYKGPLYDVMEVATHSETLEQMVVYRPQYGEMKLWVRPAAMFVEDVETDQGKVPRFKRLEQP